MGRRPGPEGRCQGAAAALLVGACAAGAAQAADDMAPTNVVFLVDGSSSMAGCLPGDVVTVGGVDVCASGSKLDAVRSVLWELSTNAEPAFFALAQTDPSSGGDGLGTLPSAFTPFPSGRAGMLSPLGKDSAAFRAALPALTLSSSNSIPLAESLRDLLYYYYLGYYHCADPTLCSSSPIDYACQENHVVVLSDGTTPPLSSAVDGNSLYGSYPATPDATGGQNAALDNLSSFLSNVDLNTSLAGVQNVTTWYVGLDLTSSWDRTLFQSAATNADSAFMEADSEDSLRNNLRTLLATILEGSYGVQPPVITVTGDYVLVGWYDSAPTTPLDRGHLAAWTVDTNPTSPTWGEIVAPDAPLWDAGVKLAARSVTPQETHATADDNDGEGVRDVFTDIDGDAAPDAFDASRIVELCPLMLDTRPADDPSDPPPGVLKGHDLDGDGLVDLDDCQALIDFVRGDPTSTFAGSTFERGAWKLGSIRLSQPAVAEPNPAIFTRNPVLRTFLTEGLPQQLTHCPSTPGACAARVAFVGANDGMIHAFNMATGEELWAWIPRNLLGETGDPDERLGTLIDLMSGETPLVDATPVVTYVWIDGYEGQGVLGSPDGEQTASEWVRVLLIGQGMGGRYYTALDITQPDEPWLLWESTVDEHTVERQGESTSTPVVGIVKDGEDDTWVAVYGSGAPVGDEPLDSRLYIRALHDLRGAPPTFRDEGTQVTVDLDQDHVDDGVGLASDPLVLDRDFDGDMDEVYLVTGSGVLYRFIIDDDDPDSVTSCLFFDPEAANLDNGAVDQAVGARLPSLHAPTAAVNAAGEVFVYWGTGSPRHRFEDGEGHVYVIKSPPGCTEGVLASGCQGDGELTLGPGEMLTSSPVVYDGVTWFTTMRPTSDRCSPGKARLYAMDSEACTARMDTNASGVAGDGDALYRELGDGLPSAPVVANGSVYVAVSNPDQALGAVIDLSRFEAASPAYGSTATIQWREIF